MPRAAEQLLVAALAISTAASACHAQRFGIVAGRTSSDVVNTSDGGSGFSSSYPDRESFTIGVSWRNRLLPAVVLQRELLLVQRGWSERSHPTLTITYLEVPVLLRVGALSNGGWPVRPVLTLGVSGALAATCSLDNLDLARAEGDGCNARIVAPFTEDYSVRRFDAGAIMGLGIEARMRGTIVGLEARYEYGLTDIRNRPGRHARNGTGFFLVNVVPLVK